MALATCFATAVERRRSLPADGMVSDPIFMSTRAITINAPPEHVWPWIAQMGSGRARWYGWDVTELTANGAPTRALWARLGWIYTVLVPAFGWGLWTSAGRSRALRMVGGLILAYASLALLWPFAEMHQSEVLATMLWRTGTAQDSRE
jgi:hypothetical protein